MSSAQDADAGANFWGVLINPDKSPAPLLEQLCLGIAQLMVNLCCCLVDIMQVADVCRSPLTNTLPPT
jgi:hypothetical protein